jgi:glutamine synthetase
MSTTDLDQHREENSRPGALDLVKQSIQDSGVQHIYYQTVTITGRVVGKVVPASHVERMAVRGVQQHRTAISNLQADRAGNLMGGGADAAEYTAVPDLDTFSVLPWDSSVGRFYCRLYEPDHVAGIGGAALATDTRGVFKRMHAEFTARTGLELRTGTEPEMTWEGPGRQAVFRADSSPAYHIEHLEKNRDIYQRVIGYAQALGFDMVEGDYEDSGQIELNWMFDRAELTADRLVTYRQICKQVARELGIEASFMPKPATGMMGNGCHHNWSLWRDEVNILEEPGTTELHLSEEGRHALGGLLTHSAGAMLAMGPTVNSYKRYWDAGQFAPSQINWGLDNKTCTVRLSANGRLEYKLPDASVNPYLTHAVILAAIDDGLKNQIDPGAPQVGSSYGTEGQQQFDALPLTLGEAITAFDQDTYLKDALGQELADLYLEYKTDEWGRFCGAVTDWERRTYWDDLP